MTRRELQGLIEDYFAQGHAVRHVPERCSAVDVNDSAFRRLARKVAAIGHQAKARQKVEARGEVFVASRSAPVTSPWTTRRGAGRK